MKIFKVPLESWQKFVKLIASASWWLSKAIFNMTKEKLIPCHLPLDLRDRNGKDCRVSGLSRCGGNARCWVDISELQADNVASFELPQTEICLVFDGWRMKPPSEQAPFLPLMLSHWIINHLVRNYKNHHETALQYETRSHDANFMVVKNKETNLADGVKRLQASECRNSIFLHQTPEKSSLAVPREIKRLCLLVSRMKSFTSKDATQNCMWPRKGARMQMRRVPLVSHRNGQLISRCSWPW